MSFTWGLIIGLIVGINIGVITHSVIVYLKNNKEEYVKIDDSEYIEEESLENRND